MLSSYLLRLFCVFSVAPEFPQILFLADNLGKPNRAGTNWCHAVWKQPRRNVQRKQQPASCWVCMYSLALVMSSNIEQVCTSAGAIQTTSGPVSDLHSCVHCCALLHSCSHFLTLRWHLHKLFSMWTHGTFPMVLAKHLSSVVAPDVCLSLLTSFKGFGPASDTEAYSVRQVYTWTDLGFWSILVSSTVL